MLTRRAAILAFTFLAGGPAWAESPTWTAAQAKERYLMAQVGASVRGWVRLEGRHQASITATENSAIAAVVANYPDLSPKDAATLAFVVLMVAARDLDADIRIPNPPLMVIEDLQARRARLGAILTVMVGRTPDYASPALRALR